MTRRAPNIYCLALQRKGWPTLERDKKGTQESASPKVCSRDKTEPRGYQRAAEGNLRLQHKVCKQARQRPGDEKNSGWPAPLGTQSRGQTNPEGPVCPSKCFHCMLPTSRDPKRRPNKSRGSSTPVQMFSLYVSYKLHPMPKKGSLKYLYLHVPKR